MPTSYNQFQTYQKNKGEYSSSTISQDWKKYKKENLDSKLETIQENYDIDTSLFEQPAIASSTSLHPAIASTASDNASDNITRTSSTEDILSSILESDKTSSMMRIPKQHSSHASQSYLYEHYNTPTESSEKKKTIIKYKKKP